MKSLKFLFAALALSVALNGCYVDRGKVSESGIGGYQQYTNKTINVSVLSPDGWDTEVTIGGEYVVTNPGKAQIIIASSELEWLMGKDNPTATGLQGFIEYRSSQLIPENIGPEFSISGIKSKLAGQDAYQFEYSYRPEGSQEMQFVKEVFTVVNGKMYKLQYYAAEDAYQKYLEQARVMQGSYKILK